MKYRGHIGFAVVGALSIALTRGECSSWKADFFLTENEQKRVDWQGGRVLQASSTGKDILLLDENLNVLNLQLGTKLTKLQGLLETKVLSFATFCTSDSSWNACKAVDQRYIVGTSEGIVEFFSNGTLTHEPAVPATVLAAVELGPMSLGDLAEGYVVLSAGKKLHFTTAGPVKADVLDHPLQRRVVTFDRVSSQVEVRSFQLVSGTSSLRSAGFSSNSGTAIVAMHGRKDTILSEIDLGGKSNEVEGRVIGSVEGEHCKHASWPVLVQPCQSRWVQFGSKAGPRTWIEGSVNAGVTEEEDERIQVERRQLEESEGMSRQTYTIIVTVSVIGFLVLVVGCIHFFHVTVRRTAKKKKVADGDDWGELNKMTREDREQRRRADSECTNPEDVGEFDAFDIGTA